jgi:hypothetical protein
MPIRGASTGSSTARAEANGPSSMPASWTDVQGPDPYTVLAAGRSHFRVEDLRRLVPGP